MDKTKKLLTIDDLAEFCQSSNLMQFNAKESGYQLVVQIPAEINFESNNSLDTKDLMFCKVKVCHCDLNRNKSFISEDNMKKALSSLRYRPLLASIHQLDDGTWDFHSHDMEYDEDGNVIYTEAQIGTFTSEMPTLEYDKDEGKTYVMANAVIPECYTMAADIIREKGGTDVSCELAIEDMSYNAKENYLELNDFYFTGCTCLGSNKDGSKVEPGMKGAHLDIADFSAQNNSVIGTDTQNQLLGMLDKLNTTLSQFSIDNPNQKGVEEEMDHLNELLEMYDVTLEDIDFDYEDMSDEELDAAFEEHFKCKKKKCDEEDPDVNDGDDDGEDEKFSKTFSIELSHDEIRYALYNLIEQYDEADNDYYFIRDVYDEYFIMQSWCTNKLYKQSYSTEESSVALEGERQEMFELILTESEKLAIEEMRSNYSTLKEFKEECEANELKAAQEAVFNDAAYAEICESDEFKALVADADKYSVDELKKECDLLFAAYVKTTGSFSAQTVDGEKPHSVGIKINTKSNKKKKAYANLFDD